MAPIIPIYEISQELNFLIAFVIGLGFGFILEQALNVIKNTTL